MTQAFRSPPPSQVSVPCPPRSTRPPQIAKSLRLFCPQNAAGNAPPENRRMDLTSPISESIAILKTKDQPSSSCSGTSRATGVVSISNRRSLMSRDNCETDSMHEIQNLSSSVHRIDHVIVCQLQFRMVGLSRVADDRNAAGRVSGFQQQQQPRRHGAQSPNGGRGRLVVGAGNLWSERVNRGLFPLLHSRHANPAKPRALGDRLVRGRIVVS